MFVPGKPFQFSLMFAGKARVYPIEAPFTLHTNIRLGWKSLPGTYTLAYYENSQVTDKQSFKAMSLAVSDE